jgi:hypothetical protein
MNDADALRDRAEAMLHEVRAYSGPDGVGALLGEIDVMIELDHYLKPEETER